MYMLFLAQVCYAQNSSDLRIHGGQDVQAVIPWQVSVRSVSGANSLTNMKDSKHECGGTILSTTTVLTAAHCAGNNFVVAAHFLAEFSTGPRLQIRRVTQRIIDPARPFSVDTLHEYGRDIQLLRVNPPFDFSKGLRAARLPDRAASNYGGDIKIAGWGLISSSANAGRLQELTVRQLACEKKAPDQFCVAPGNPSAGGACHGDGGGPAIAGGDIVVGVASWFYNDCSDSTGSRYTDVFNFVAFIKSQDPSIGVTTTTSTTTVTSITSTVTSITSAVTSITSTNTAPSNMPSPLIPLTTTTTTQSFEPPPDQTPGPSQETSGKDPGGFGWMPGGFGWMAVCQVAVGALAIFIVMVLVLKWRGAQENPRLRHIPMEKKKKRHRKRKSKQQYERGTGARPDQKGKGTRPDQEGKGTRPDQEGKGTRPDQMERSATRPRLKEAP